MVIAMEPHINHWHIQDMLLIGPNGPELISTSSRPTRSSPAAERRAMGLFGSPALAAKGRPAGLALFVLAVASAPALAQAAALPATAGWTREFLSYTVEPFLLQGALLAIEIAALAMVGGVVLGLGLALMRLSRLSPVRGLAWFYIWFVRGTPQLLQLVFIYDALPPLGIKLDTFTTAVLGFALNEAAFSAEIIRGGILSVNRNQSRRGDLASAWARS